MWVSCVKLKNCRGQSIRQAFAFESRETSNTSELKGAVEKFKQVWLSCVQHPQYFINLTVFNNF